MKGARAASDVSDLATGASIPEHYCTPIKVHSPNPNLEPGNFILTSSTNDSIMYPVSYLVPGIILVPGTCIPGMDGKTRNVNHYRTILGHLCATP